MIKEEDKINVDESRQYGYDNSEKYDYTFYNILKINCHSVDQSTMFKQILDSQIKAKKYDRLIEISMSNSYINLDTAIEKMLEGWDDDGI